MRVGARGTAPTEMHPTRMALNQKAPTEVVVQWVRGATRTEHGSRSQSSRRRVEERLLLSRVPRIPATQRRAESGVQTGDRWAAAELQRRRPGRHGCRG